MPGKIKEKEETMSGQSEDELSQEDEEAMELAPCASGSPNGKPAAEPNILQSFWGLASIKEDERLHSALTLLMHVRKAQGNRMVY